MKTILFVLSMLIGMTSQAQSFCQNKTLENVPVLADGRIKPLRVHATEIKKKVFTHNCDVSDAELFCYLSLGQRANLQNEKKCEVLLKVDHEKVMKLLSRTGHDVLPEIAEKNQFALRTEYENEERLGRRESGYALSLARVLTGLAMLKEIEAGQDWKVLTEGHQWQPLTQIPSEEREKIIFSQESLLKQQEAEALKYEIILDRLNPFSVAIWLGLLAFLLTLGSLRLPRLFNYGYVASVGLYLLQILTMVLRTLVSGRAPVANMFETVMWAGFGILTLGLILSWKKKDSKILSIALGVIVIILFMMRFSTTMLDSSIRPLAPVLRDNFWLSTHVTTITLSYSCFAFGWFIANVALVLFLTGRMNTAQVLKMNETIRLNMQVGSVLLAAGIILGGVWADYSWGRFWGWDPKETWSLIALMIYMMILHGKYAGWFKNIYFTMLGAFGFMFVLMAWFGVNYILATGLHSYGFSSGGAAFLASIFGAQMAILLGTWLRIKNASSGVA